MSAQTCPNPQKLQDSSKSQYKIHPVATLFPLIPKGSSAYTDLEKTIRSQGQLEPIVVDGDTLLDGRNRLAICLGLGITPKVVEWSTLRIEIPQHEWIFAVNAARRHLTEDQRLAICVEYVNWTQAEKKKQQTQFKPGICPNPSGRAGKQADLKSGPPVKRDIAQKHANSTAGMVAASAGVSRHKAEKALAISKASEAGDTKAQENLEAIKQGRKTMREITKKPKREKPANEQIMVEEEARRSTGRLEGTADRLGQIDREFWQIFKKTHAYQWERLREAIARLDEVTR